MFPHGNKHEGKYQPMFYRVRRHLYRRFKIFRDLTILDDSYWNITTDLFYLFRVFVVCQICPGATCKLPSTIILVRVKYNFSVSF